MYACSLSVALQLPAWILNGVIEQWVHSDHILSSVNVLVVCVVTYCMYRGGAETIINAGIATTFAPTHCFVNTDPVVMLNDFS